MLRRILEQLTKRLELVYLVAAELELRLTLASGNQHLRVFRIPAPTNNLQVLFRMLETHLETLRTDSAIVALELLAQPGNPGQHQFGLFEATLRSPNQFAETLARLTALCGPENAGTPQLEATHRPDAFRMTPPTFADSPEEAVADPAAAARQTGRQLRRFRPAQPAAIEFAGGQPAAIRCEAARGAVMEVRGPFHNSGGWWDGRGWAREEWDARTSDGVLCRVVRTGEGCFVEGVYD
jgi:protein ImuB